jgi:hypothetical protein
MKKAENPPRFYKRKLKPYLKGPFRVESCLEDYFQYTVRNLVTNNIRTYHVKRLKAFQVRPEDTDLTKYAVKTPGGLAVFNWL